MPLTTMKIQIEIRDWLARVAARDYPGAKLSEVLGHLLTEHEQARTRLAISTAYARLNVRDGRWSAYVSELDEWDGVAADGTSDR
jgi:hypothetical protein